MKASECYIPKIKYVNGFSTDEFTIQYEIERYDGEDGDTKVYLNDDEHCLRLCWISGKEVDNFNKEFEALINKYKI